MKAKFITFVRGLMNGTPPRFQSYLKSLTLLLVMAMSINVWGAKVNGSYTFGGDAVSGWECNPQTKYCNLYYSGKNNEATIKNANISNIAKIDFSAVSNPSIKISVSGICNTGTNTYTVSLINSSGTVLVSSSAQSNKFASGSNASDAKSSFVTLTPTEGVTGYQIKIGAKCCLTGTSYELTYEESLPIDVTLSRNGMPEVFLNKTNPFILPKASDESAACDGWDFKGWSTSSISSTTTAPTFVTKATSSGTYYAVYGKTEEGDGKAYTMVTTVDGIVPGIYAIAVNKVNTSKFNFADGTIASGGHAGVESTGVATATSYTALPANAVLYTLAGNNTDGFSIKKNSDGTYLVATSSGGSLSFSETATEKWKFTLKEKDENKIGFVLTGNLGSKMSSNSTTTTTTIRNYASSGSYYDPLFFFIEGVKSTTTYTTSPECAAPKVLTGITIKTKPTKQTYTVGDNFDPSGLIITASYDDVTSSDVSYAGNESMFAFEGNDISTTGNKTVTIKYTEGGVTKSDTYSITVNAKAALESISVNTDNCQTNFIKNEEFNSTGLVVTAHYVGGATETVTSSATIDASAYVKGTANTYTINVSYTEESIKKETSYNVNVWELSASSSNTNLGTVGRSAYVITGNPKDGVTYANPAYTVDGAADVVQGTGANINKFTVSNITANTKVTINFVEKVKDTYVDQMHGQLTTGNVFYDSYNAPTISYSHTTTGDNCLDDHIYFAGWTENPTQVGSPTAPADMFAAGKSMTAGNKTYYAVWAKGEGSANVTYTKVTKTADLVDGTYLLSTGSRVYAGKNGDNSNAKSVSGNESSSKYTSLPSGAVEIRLKWNDGKTAFSLYDGTSYLKMNGDNTSLIFVDTETFQWCINGGPSYINFKNTTYTSRFIKCNTNASNVFSTYGSSTNNTSWVYPYLKSGGLTYTDYLTACCTPLAAPNVTVTAQTTNSLTFSWDGVTGATGYEYKLSTATDWTPTTETSATISNLEAGTEYTIQVRATDNTGNYCENGTIAEKTGKTYYNTEIYITTPPKKTVYVEGETFDKEGMVVRYTHEATGKYVSSDVTWSPNGALTTDVTEITVSYKVSDDVTLTTTQAITVKAKWTMLYYINGAEYKRYCAEGDAAEVPTVAGTDLEPEGFTFMGWVTTAMATESETEPSYALAKNATSYTPTKNNDKLYSVYKREEVAMKDGYKLYETTNKKWVGPRSGTDSYFTYKTDASQAEIFLIDQLEGQMAFVSDGKPTYFYGYSKNSTITFKSTLDADGAWAIVNNSNIYTFMSKGEYYFAYNTSSPRFATYSGSTNGQFSLTPAKVEVSQPYYNTKATVPTVDHIEVKTAPTTTTYFEGDKFDATGLVVWAYYSAEDEVGKEVPASQYTLQIGTETDLANYDLKATDANVVITFRNAQCSQLITVNAITLMSINVTTGPTQTKYTPGAAFNPAGMVVYAVYNDTRKNKNVPLKVGDADGYTYSPATLTELGEQDVTISYTDGTRGTQTTTTTVIVNSALNEIRVKTNPAKMIYIEGELFDKTGMVVEGSYGEPAEWKDITGWTYEPTTAIVAKGSLTTDEQRDITIHYTESGVNKSTTLKVTVQPYPRYTVTFSVNGNTDLKLTETAPEGGITIPTNPAAIGDYTFAGWAEATMPAESPEKPGMIAEAVGATYHITANKTLYAVYSMEKEGDLQGYTMTSIVDDQGTEKTISYFSDKEFMPVDGSHSALTLYFANGYLFYMSGNEANYVYFTDLGKADLTKNTYINQAKNYLWTEVKNDDGTYSYYRTNGTSTRYLAWNSSYWRAYGTTTTTNNTFTKTAAGSPIKYVMPHYTTSPETAKTPVVKFNTSTASTPVLTDAADHTSLATYFNNTFSTENTTGAVVYTLADGDDAVATIAADGTVTAKKAGLVTVTATVGAVAGEWKEASASYTLTFTKIAPTIAFDDNQPTEVYVGNVVTVHATSNSDGSVYYYDNSDKLDVNPTTGEVTGIATTTGVNVYAYVDATDLFTAKNTTSTGAKISIKVKDNAKTQTLTFAKPEGYDFAPNAIVDPFINTLNGAKTTVTYSLKAGSTDGLVTVNETTGEVTVNTNLSGSATVVATAEAGKITEEEIIWAYGEATAEYMISVNYFRPVLTLTPGLDTQQELWRCTQTVSLTAQEGDKIYYTLDGTDPTTSSTLYNAPFDVDDKMVDANLQVIIKAIAVSNDGLQTSPVLTKTLTKAIPTMTAKVGEEDVTDDYEIELDANDVVTLKATACKIDYRILNHEGTEIEKKVGNATTEIIFSKGGTFTLEATPRWNNTNGFNGEKNTWTVNVKGAGHLPINYNGNNTGLAELSYFSKDGTFGNYSTDHTKIKIEGGTLTVSFLEEPTELSYYIKLNGTADDGNLFVVEGSATGDKNSWTEISKVVGKAITTTETKYEFTDINPDFRYIRWTYTKKNGNLGLGDIHIGTTTLIVDDSKDLDPTFSGNVIVENGGKLTVVDLSEITDLTIEPGGIVDAHTYNAALTVNNLYLQSADHKSGQFLVDNNDIDIEGNAYFDLTLNAAPRTWYDFAVPFKVNRNSISLANGEAMPEYDIMQYNGETRAANGANKSAWEYVDEGDLNPGTFYMIMFASNVETIRFTKNDGAMLNNADYVVVSEYESQTGNPLDANWNGIANNTLQYVNLGFTEVDNVNIKAQVYNPTSKSYTAYNKNEVTFVVGAPFFVQVAKEDLVDWSTAPIHDILRAPSSEVKSVGEFTLELIDKGVTCDRLFVSASEDATDSYQIGHDLAKMGISTTVAQMWINNYNTKLCANEAVLINGQATYPMEVFVPEEGEYKIAITNAPENATLYLTIDGQVAWNLSESAYVGNLTKGNHNEFGLLLIANERTTPTNINGLNGNNKAQKIFKDYNIYILRDTKMYNAQGIKVQ